MNFKFRRGLTAFLAFVIALCLLFAGCEERKDDSDFNEEFPPRQTSVADVDKSTNKATNKVTNKDTEKSTSKDDDFEDNEEDVTLPLTDKKDTDKTLENTEKVSDVTDSTADNGEQEDTSNVTNTDESEDGAQSTENSESVESDDVILETEKDYSADPDGIPAYSGSPYFVLNGNKPEFLEDEITTKSYEFYSELDSLKRCGYTIACVGKDIMPTDDRESISSVKPSGWINKEYDSSLVDGRYIYNRCHLIGFQLTGENANKQNLITGTRYMNVDGMLPFENMVADYVKETNNHVMYRVTPIYIGDNLVASGVQMEAFSVEDDGEGICFNVYVYNVQPGITINYATGDNWLTGGKLPETETETDAWDGKYILNISSKKIHKSTCSGAQTIKEHNKKEHEGSLDSLIADGYTGCGTCNPIK